MLDTSAKVKKSSPAVSERYEYYFTRKERKRKKTENGLIIDEKISGGINMKRRAIIVMLIIVLAVMSIGASKQSDEIKRMGIFLSNFTELGFYNFDLEPDGDEDTLHFGSDEANSELILFGIGHNIINNKKLITRCKDKNCEYGSSVISAQNVAASVKKYFDLDIKHESHEGEAPEVHYDRKTKTYHFDPDNFASDTIYYAEVQEVRRGKKVITMSGELYNLDNKKDRPGTFVARAKPYKWNGKDTWSILSLEVEWY